MMKIKNDILLKFSGHIAEVGNSSVCVDKGSNPLLEHYSICHAFCSTFQLHLVQVVYMYSYINNRSYI